MIRMIFWTIDLRMVAAAWRGNRSRMLFGKLCRHALVPVVVLCLFFIPLRSSVGEDSARDWAFVRQVLMSPEYGTDDGLVSRWRTSPTYRVFVEREDHRLILIESVDEINGVLRKTGFKINLVFDKPDHPDGIVGFLPADQFQRILSSGGCSYIDDENNGLICNKVNVETKEYFSTFIMIDNSLERINMRATVLEEVYQSLGIVNDHMIYEDSVAYEDELGGTVRATLAPIDKKVLIFLYKYLEPGDDEATVRRKFDAHWHEIAVD